MAQAIIETKGLTKKYKDKAAVNDVSILIEKGDIYGLIGKNGAGKTTLMRLILGLTQGDEGLVKLFESDDLSTSRYKIGSLIEEPGLYYGKTALENMRTFSLLYDDVTDEEIKDILKLVELDNTGNKKVKGFSLGMKQRLGIAIALMGHPKVLILDEPINGLDPLGIKQIRDMILKLNKSGVTIMISSHFLGELGKVVTKYGIMVEGKIVEEALATELNAKWQNEHSEDSFEDYLLAKLEGRE